MIAIREFLRHESASGVILMLAAVLALVFDNSPLAWLYDGLLDTPLAIQVGALKIAKPLLLWINEVLEGELSSIDKAALPAVAAVGGMAMPAAVFVAINWGNAETLKGWAIPAATDIAFALGILALLGTRVPLALKVFLLALAIIDDLGAIVIIALFYTDGLSTTALSLAAIGIVGLILLNRLGVTRLTPYVLVGIFMWVCVLKSGVHATLAGVALAFAIPLRVKGNAETAPLRLLEHELHPWVAYGVMPIFAFANAGVPLGGLSFADLLAPLPLGIAAGLFIGKQVGVMSFVWIAVRVGLCRLPPGISWAQIYGVALLAGIGFTMSLFIGTLAFEDPSQASGVRLGVLCGSITSAICGYLLLRLRSEAPNPARA